MFRNTELLKIAACVPLGIFYSASTARNGRPILALLVVVVVALLGLVVDESAFVALGVVVLVVVRVEVHLVHDGTRAQRHATDYTPLATVKAPSPLGSPGD